MTILTSIILIAAIIGVAAAIAYNVQKGTKTLEEMRSNYYDNESFQEAEAVVRQALETPAPKRVATPKTVEKSIETTTVTVEATVEAPKKKKGHRYNRKPKTQTPTT